MRHCSLPHPARLAANNGTQNLGQFLMPVFRLFNDTHKNKECFNVNFIAGKGRYNVYRVKLGPVGPLVGR